MSHQLPPKLQDLQDPTPAQAQTILQVSAATIWRLCKSGALQKYKIGNSSRIKRESIEALRNQAA